MLGALCIATFHCREREREAGSSQDLNVSIIHEVVLRYANMNYLTSRADLLLCLTPPTSLSLHIFSFSPPFTPLYSYTSAANLNLRSEQRLFLGAVFAELSRAQRSSESPSLPLCSECFLPLYGFSPF